MISGDRIVSAWSCPFRRGRFNPNVLDGYTINMNNEHIHYLCLKKKENNYKRGGENKEEKKNFLQIMWPKSGLFINKPWPKCQQTILYFLIFSQKLYFCVKLSNSKMLSVFDARKDRVNNRNRMIVSLFRNSATLVHHGRF